MKMKIYYDSWIARLFTFMSGFRTIMLFGAVFTERKEGELSRSSKEHEGVHCGQYVDLFWAGVVIAVLHAVVIMALRGWNVAPTHYAWWLLCWPLFFFYVYYVLEFTVRLFGSLYRHYLGQGRTLIYPDGRFYEACIEAYRNIAFEREAYALQEEWRKECPERKSHGSFGWCNYY